MNRGHGDIYPSYDRVLEEKKKTYPDEFEVDKNGIKASVSVSELIKHTIKRLLGIKNIQEKLTDQDASCELLYKVRASCKTKKNDLLLAKPEVH